MSKKLFVGAMLSLTLTACGVAQTPANDANSVNRAVFTADLLEVSAASLKDYWQPKPVKPLMYQSRPKWIPKGAGKFSYFVAIDSEGNEVSKTLVGSSPEGWMSQNRLDKMPKVSYLVSDNNPAHIPVKVLFTSEVMPRSAIKHK